MTEIRNLINLVESAQRKPEWHTVMVYGSFTDPATDKNFFLVRVPLGRKPWAKKIAPAIDRVVRGLFSAEAIKTDRDRRRTGRESLIHWNVEGEDKPGQLWNLKQDVTRYEWTGTELVKAAKPETAGSNLMAIPRERVTEMAEALQWMADNYHYRRDIHTARLLQDLLRNTNAPEIDVARDDVVWAKEAVQQAWTNTRRESFRSTLAYLEKLNLAA